MKTDSNKTSPLSSPVLSPKLSQYFSSEDLPDCEKEDKVATSDEFLKRDIDKASTCSQSNNKSCKSNILGNCCTSDRNLTDDVKSCEETNLKLQQYSTSSDGIDGKINTSNVDEKETEEEQGDNKNNASYTDPVLNVSDCAKDNRKAVIFYCSDGSFPTITEEGSEVNEDKGSVVNDDISKKEFACSSGIVLSLLRRTGSDENFLGDSLDVNIDSTSINTISDEDEDYLCTQYSESDLLKDSEHNSDSQDCLSSNCGCEADKGENPPDSADKIETDNSNTDKKLEVETAEIESPVGVDKVGDRKSDQSDNEGKILKYFHTQSLVKEETESDISAFESYYSLDNTCSGIGTPVVKRIKKTLTWTPRILSEERFANSRSTTLSSKASFYTAETSGTFFSARSFQLDSCDNFVTCEDFQKLDFDEEPKSKLSKAKNVLVRGRDFVKSKIDCYRKRLPNLTNNTNIKSRILCHNSCGFSCVQKGKEISLYSLPDLQTKGNADSGITESERKEIDSSENNDTKDICKAGMSADSKGDMTVRKVLEEKRDKEGASKHCNGTGGEVERNGNVDDLSLKHTGKLEAFI